MKSRFRVFKRLFHDTSNAQHQQVIVCCAIARNVFHKCRQRYHGIKVSWWITKWSAGDVTLMILNVTSADCAVIHLSRYDLWQTGTPRKQSGIVSIHPRDPSSQFTIVIRFEISEIAHVPWLGLRGSVILSVRIVMSARLSARSANRPKLVDMKAMERISRQTCTLSRMICKPSFFLRFCCFSVVNYNEMEPNLRFVISPWIRILNSVSLLNPTEDFRCLIRMTPLTWFMNIMNIMNMIYDRFHSI